MKQRILISLTVAALTCTPAFAQSTSGSSTTSTNTNSPNVSSFFNSLAGEWDGQVITTKDGRTSSSQVNASNHVERDGGQFASCFQGYSFGQPFQGGSVFSSQNGKFFFASTDSLNTEPCRGSFTVNTSGWTCTFERTDKAGKATKFEQVTTIVNNDNYTVECFSFDSNGRKHEVMVMDMNRMPAGQKSEAANTFATSPMLAKARQTLANSAQATVDDSH